jgi:hypothetical protein
VTCGKYDFNGPDFKTTLVFVETKNQRSMVTLYTFFSLFSYQQCFVYSSAYSFAFPPLFSLSSGSNFNCAGPLFFVSTVLRRVAFDTNSKMYR